MYPGYLKKFYQKYPAIMNSSYNDHYSALLSDSTEFVASYTKTFCKLGINASAIIANDEFLQTNWKVKNSIKKKDFKNLIFQQILHHKPDVLWIEDLRFVDSYLLSDIKQKVKSIKLIVAYHCSPWNSLILNKLKAFDFVITCTPGLKQEFENAGIKSYLVYHGFDTDLLPKLHIPGDITEKSLVFSGSLFTGDRYHNSRIALIETLLKENVHLSLYVTLDKEYRIRAKQILFSINSFLKKIRLEQLSEIVPFFEYGRSPVIGYSEALLRSNNKPLYGIDMFNLFISSKIVLNMHIGVAGDYAGNMRLFEVTGSGSCLLTDNKKNMPDLFDINKEVVVYDSPEDCISKVRWLLDNEDQRKRIAGLGQKKTLESHTVQDRCKSIIAIINSQL